MLGGENAVSYKQGSFLWAQILAIFGRLAWYMEKRGKEGNSYLMHPKEMELYSP